MFGCLHGSGDLPGLALEFSPVVERIAGDTVAFDATGLERLFGFPQDVAAAIMRRAAETGVQAALALASNADAAVCAARGFAGVSIVPFGDEAKFLSELPVSLLAPSGELLETLERWGIRQFHQLAALPPLGIAERLGPEGLRLRELARGEALRKLVPLEDSVAFEDELELEYPVELLEPLAFLLARLLNGLCTRLVTRALATNELRLRLKLEGNGPHERTLRLPVPSIDSTAFLKLLQLDLTAHPPSAPVVHIWLGVNPVKPRAAQEGLFAPASPEPVKLELTLARIQAIVGEGNAGSPEPLNTHRPDAFRIRPVQLVSGVVNDPAVSKWDSPPGLSSTRVAFRFFRPPRPARIAVEDGRPAAVAAPGIRGRVTQSAGPWRSSGDWWTADPWTRDEWDISLSDGALYRIYCGPEGWFVEGSYD
jgi:protein ImuB